MKEILLDTIIDSVKLLPFLFVTFLLLEFIEHKMKNKSKKIITKAGRFGPLFGGLLGAIPQCGFSVVATNFYATRVITLGTLIAIYLSTSDEMLPILLSEKANISLIVLIIGIKIIIGIISGIIMDFILKDKQEIDIKDFCNDSHCDCEHNHSLIKSSLKHTINIIIYILIITFILNAGFYFLGEENISKIFLKGSLFAPFMASLIGLIPNCGASVVITELYLNNTITFGSMMAGLLTGSGIALLVLFKVNKNKKENIKILTIIYLIGVLVGLILDILGIAL